MNFESLYAKKDRQAHLALFFIYMYITELEVIF